MYGHFKVALHMYTLHAHVHLCVLYYIHIYMYIYIYIYIYMHTYIHEYIHTYIHTYTQADPDMWAEVQPGVATARYRYFCTYVNMFVRVHVLHRKAKCTARSCCNQIQVHVRTFVYTSMHVNRHEYTHTREHSYRAEMQPDYICAYICV
jgi:hypothetical protein